MPIDSHSVEFLFRPIQISIPWKAIANLLVASIGFVSGVFTVWSTPGLAFWVVPLFVGSVFFAFANYRQSALRHVSGLYLTPWIATGICCLAPQMAFKPDLGSRLDPRMSYFPFFAGIAGCIWLLVLPWLSRNQDWKGFALAGLMLPLTVAISLSWTGTIAFS